ncbi:MULTISPECIES: hypothetical protein [Sphingomonas]|uniref:hypothetical protein n=1 Tax=Sphingomonas TaxID=13687 RepID=UPI000AA142FF|nr:MULTISPECIES: hypothetical protein [Sphingomonas]MDY0965808.1 hypothetical protein [Sphingomonas sp. CFBP9021]USQ99465.1 hypothetical protein NEF64_13680 [Sphingomonas aerolata]
MSDVRLILGGAAALFVAAPALAQSDSASGSGQGARRVVVRPYIEATQILTADLGGGDVLTYTSLAAGVDAAVSTARINGQVSYRYERRFAYDDDIGDTDIHSGLARVEAQLTRNLSLEAGGIATRSRSDIRGAAPGVLVGNVSNIAQVYAVYGGPNFAAQAGDVALNANYRLGYTKVETPTFGTAATGGQRLDYYDDSIGHTATASAGFRPGTLLPVGLTASAGFDRETAGQLSQRYQGYFGRGDAVLPVSPYVALTAGLGYERIETSQKDALVDAAGVPVLDRDGRFRTAPGSPRRIAYRTDGLYYDAGVIWRPNRRTSVEARIGERYGSLSFTGTATYQASKDIGVAVNVYDGVQTFGRQLRTGLANLPTSFLAPNQGFAQQFNGCVFGATGAAPGGCLDDVFQSISTSSYRARGIDAVLVATRGRTTFGGGIGYANRRLFAPRGAPGLVVTGLEDESYYGQLYFARSLSSVSGINATAFVNYFDSQLGGGFVTAGDGGVWSYGATGTYYRNFGRLGTTASLGLYSFKVGDFDSDWSAQALLGARYQF